MQFCFYPRHEYACPEVGHCPHLGGAALATLVSVASQNGSYQQMLLGQLDAERQRNAELLQQNEALCQQIEQLKLELKLERQSKFTSGRGMENAEEDENSAGETEEPSCIDGTTDSAPRKRGAPLGHPGWYRPQPAAYDQLLHVDAPQGCPLCGGDVQVCDDQDPLDHWQEDLVAGVPQVVVYRHAAARCGSCGDLVQQAGEGELLGSRIGPRLRAMAMFLRNEIGMTYRKVPRTLSELFNFRFTPAALVGFEKVLAGKAEPLVDDIAKKIGSSDGPVHADETYWTLDGERAYYWVHGDEKFMHFQFDTSRSGQVSRDVLGAYFDGVLVTDCYAGYEAHTARAKQKCMAHLARTARDWQRLTKPDSAARTFFEDVKQWVKRGCEFHRRRGQLSPDEQAAEKAWLQGELQRLESCELDHAKAITLQARIRKHHAEWLVFLDDPRVPPTNNLAERALRPLVVLRKLTFGHRTEAGARRMAKILTIQETAKRHGHKAIDIFYRLQTQPPDRVLEHLYAGPSNATA